MTLLMLHIDWSEIVLIIIGAIIGFVGSISTIIVHRIIDRKGKIKIYFHFSNIKNLNRGGWGFVDNNGLLTILLIPINFEIQNTSNATRVIRDVSLLLYNNSKQVCKMIQIEKSGNGRDEDMCEFGGEKHSYSFVLPPSSIQKQTCEFAWRIEKKEASKYQFNKIVLSYFDEKDKQHLFTIKEIDGNWDMKTFKSDIDWSLAGTLE